MPFTLRPDASPYERAAYILAGDLDRWPWERAHTLAMTTRYVVEQPPFRDLMATAVAETGPGDTPPRTLDPAAGPGHVGVAVTLLRDLIAGEDREAYRPSEADMRGAVYALRALLYPAWGIASTDDAPGPQAPAWRLYPKVLANVTGLTVEGLRTIVRLHVFDVDDAARLLFNGRTLRNRAELRFPPGGGPARFYA